MSNQAKEVIRVVGEELERFEADNICLRRTDVQRMGGVSGHRSEYTEWIDTPYISRTVDGKDLSGQFNQITGMAVPHRVNIYSSVPFKLNSTDTLDQGELSRKLRSAFQAIDNRINRAVANAVMVQGSQTVTSSTPLSGFQDVADVETLLTENDVNQLSEKTLILNPGDYNRMANDLQVASRSINKGTISETAYEKAQIAEIADFMTFKTSFAPNKAAAAGAAITVSGAGQVHTPQGHTTDAEGNPTNVDNRYQNLTVSATTNVVAGDKFTIAGVNAASLQNKNDTGNLKTFTVVEVVDGSTLKISPAIVPADVTVTDTGTQAQYDFANVVTAPADAAALTFLNIADAQTNPFWVNEAVSINVAPFVGSENDVGGMILMNETTELGLPVVLAKQGSINDLSTDWRLTTFFGITIRCPEMTGILLGSQT